MAHTQHGGDGALRGVSGADCDVPVPKAAVGAVLSAVDEAPAEARGPTASEEQEARPGALSLLGVYSDDDSDDDDGRDDEHALARDAAKADKGNTVAVEAAGKTDAEGREDEANASGRDLPLAEENCQPGENAGGAEPSEVDAAEGEATKAEASADGGEGGNSGGSCEDGAKTGGGGAPATQSGQAEEAAKPAEDPLPAGWAKHTDSRTGHMYFFHAQTGQSSWERPANQGAQQPAAGPATGAAGDGASGGAASEAGAFASLRRAAILGEAALKSAAAKAISSQVAAVPPAVRLAIELEMRVGDWQALIMCEQLGAAAGFGFLANSAEELAGTVQAQLDAHAPEAVAAAAAEAAAIQRANANIAAAAKVRTDAAAAEEAKRAAVAVKAWPKAVPKTALDVDVAETPEAVGTAKAPEKSTAMQASTVAAEPIPSAESPAAEATNGKEKKPPKEKKVKGSSSSMGKKASKMIGQWAAKQKELSGEGTFVAPTNPSADKERPRKRRAVEVKAVKAEVKPKVPDLVSLTVGLPVGWHAMLDEARGAVYYANAGTGETTWHRPQ